MYVVWCSIRKVCVCRQRTGLQPPAHQRRPASSFTLIPETASPLPRPSVHSRSSTTTPNRPLASAFQSIPCSIYSGPTANLSRSTQPLASVTFLQSRRTLFIIASSFQTPVSFELIRCAQPQSVPAHFGLFVSVAVSFHCHRVKQLVGVFLVHSHAPCLNSIPFWRTASVYSSHSSWHQGAYRRLASSTVLRSLSSSFIYLFFQFVHSRRCIIMFRSHSCCQSFHIQ